MINKYLENDNNLMLAIDLNEKEMREIVESKKWEDVDFSQVKPLLDDLASMTFGLCRKPKEEPFLDRDFSYVAFYEFDFNEQCNLCLLQAFGYTEGYYIDTDIVKLEVNKESLQEFFLALKQKYNDHILAVVYKFINVAIVITEENADKIENVKYEGCEYEGCFYHCFRCEVVTDDYCCRDCTKWENDEFECTKCLFKYIQENKLYSIE